MRWRRCYGKNLQITSKTPDLSFYLLEHLVFISAGGLTAICADAQLWWHANCIDDAAIAIFFPHVARWKQKTEAYRRRINSPQTPETEEPWPALLSKVWISHSHVVSRAAAPPVDGPHQIVPSGQLSDPGSSQYHLLCINGRVCPCAWKRDTKNSLSLPFHLFMV